MYIYTSKHCQDILFYIYDYLRSSKSKSGDVGSPYYVGKGKENRAFEKHQKGISVPKDKDNIRTSKLMNEADSLQAEMLKIYLNGRIDLGTGCLRNRTDGGDGGIRISEESMTKRVANTLATKKKNGTMNISSPEAIRKQIETKKKNGTLSQTKEAIEKGLFTRKQNGTLNPNTPVSILKRLATRKRHGNWNTTTKQVIEKGLATKIANGTLNCVTLESIAKGLETKRKNGTAKNNITKSWETRRKNGTDKHSKESSARGWATRRRNLENKLPQI